MHPYDYSPHLCLKAFLLTSGLITTNPTPKAAIVAKSCPRLNPSLKTSNSPLGATLVQNKSNPTPNTKLVDSNTAALVTTRTNPNNSFRCESVHFRSSGTEDSYGMSPSSFCAVVSLPLAGRSGRRGSRRRWGRERSWWGVRRRRSREVMPWRVVVVVRDVMGWGKR